jgi:DNA-directed RNA polymerase subunit RPC12/RpoP
VYQYFSLFSENPDEAKVESPVTAKKELKKVKKYECFVCLKKFRSKDNMQLHSKIHEDKENADQNKVKKSAVPCVSSPGGARGFSCPSLGKTFNVRDLINRLKELKCKLCSKKFNTKELFDGHMKLHEVKEDDTLKGSDDPEIEQEVKKTKKEVFKISNHRRSPSKRTKILPSKLNHEEKCNSGGKFQCPYCKSKFSLKHNLKTHIKKKHEEKTSLDTHVQQKHEEISNKVKKFECSICSKSFQFKDIMQLFK